MCSIRRDDADITRMQRVPYPLDRSISSAVIHTEDLKKFMLMRKNRRVAVVLVKHDILDRILKEIFFFHIRRPGSAQKFRNIQVMFQNKVSIQIEAVVLKCLRILLFL